MKFISQIKNIKSKISGEILFDENLSKHSWFNIGGLAKVIFKPGNLNHMLKFTKGEYIVVFDSDFLPEKDFLKRIIAPFIHNNKIDAVQARWRIKNFSQNINLLPRNILEII